VYSALSFGAKRIGHGVRSVEDGALLSRLAESGVTLELCPTSNLNTRVFERIEDYPLRKLIDAGVRVTLNTDNTSVSNTTLAREYQLIADTFLLTEGEIRQFAISSLKAAFLDDAEKERLLRKLEI
jgi:adenosine deaminase